MFWSLAGDERPLITTSYALVETHALVARRLGFEKVRQLVASLKGAVEIVWVGEEMHDWAWGKMEERDGIGLSLVDWSLAWIAERDNASILTFDRDFSSEGLSVLPEGPR